MQRTRSKSRSRKRQTLLISDIDKIFKESFVNVKDKDKYENTTKDVTYNIGYGEITNTAIKNIISFVKKHNKKKPKTFIDLGCGSGRGLSYALYNGIKNIKGVELVKERYNFAKKSLKKLSKNDVVVLNYDLFDLPKTFFPDNSLIFISNLLFPVETNQKMIEFLNNNVKPDTFIALTKIPEKLYDFKLIDHIETPMSWCSESKCYILKK